MSVTQSTAAKILSTVGMFLGPWLALVVAGVSLVVGRQDIPNGIIPVLLVLAGYTFVGFCAIAGVALVSESEAWTIAATIALNSSYGLAWYALIRTPTIKAGLGSPVVVWSPAVLTILLGEIAAIAAILALTFYVQTRKRDFV